MVTVICCASAPEAVKTANRDVRISLMISGFMSAAYPIPKFYFQICQRRSAFLGVTIPALGAWNAVLVNPPLPGKKPFGRRLAVHRADPSERRVPPVSLSIQSRSLLTESVYQFRGASNFFNLVKRTTRRTRVTCPGSSSSCRLRTVVMTLITAPNAPRARSELSPA
jgi:hypothetical protein